jgi:hypothetical protein
LSIFISKVDLKQDWTQFFAYFGFGYHQIIKQLP